VDLKRIEELHKECKKGDKDLYSFLEERHPELSIEERLKMMAEVLNEYLEEYHYDQADKLKKEGYSITRFVPKK